jgi:hypothetical protein
MACDGRDPTPGEPNRLLPPQFSLVGRTPAWPGAGEGVTVTAVITAGNPIASATLWYDAGSGFQAVPMVGDRAYVAHIPPQPGGTLVSYYLEAVDGIGQGTFHPPAAPAVPHRYLVGYAPPAVLVNEFLADNESVNQDQAGEYDDWVELYNAGSAPATLDGMYLTDDLSEPRKWQIPAGTTIPPGGYLLVWCDKDAGQGPLHAGFKLNRDGEEIGLFCQRRSRQRAARYGRLRRAARGRLLRAAAGRVGHLGLPRSTHAGGEQWMRRQSPSPKSQSPKPKWVHAACLGCFPGEYDQGDM